MHIQGRKVSAKRAREEYYESDESESHSDSDASSEISLPQPKKQKTAIDTAASELASPPHCAHFITLTPPITQTPQELEGGPSYAGNFDIYGMNLPFLKKVYLPKDTPQFEALYNEIMTFQAKPDFSGRCYFPPGVSGDGSFVSNAVAEPMGDEAYEIALTGLTKKEISFNQAELSKFPDPASTRSVGPGIKATVELADDGCMPSSGRGEMKMKRVWTKEVNVAEDVTGVKSSHEYSGSQELFEGVFTLKVKYSGMLKRKGFGSGEDYKFGFWAVRARIDETGKEVGLKE